MPGAIADGRVFRSARGLRPRHAFWGEVRLMGDPQPEARGAHMATIPSVREGA